MAAVRFLFCIVCFGLIGRGDVRHGDMLDENIVTIAAKEVGVREMTGHNDGARIEEYLHCVGLHKGQPYCAAFVSWVFKQAGYAAPRMGWSPALFPIKKLVKTVVPGVVFSIYFPALKRIGHCGFVAKVRSDWVCSVEANTNDSGGREGSGVYHRMRHKRSIHSYADWRNGRCK